MTRLLVSVRSVAEADIAQLGGAEVIDVKEPLHGSLGRAADEVLTGIHRRFAGRAALSAALGELAEAPPPVPACFQGYVKLGLAGAGRMGLTETLNRWSEKLTSAQPLVLASYADWRRAGAPSPEEAAELAHAHRCAGLLIDTWKKDGSRLLDWLTLDDLHRLRQQTRQAGLLLALAGSLRLEDVPLLLEVEADLLGFRTAACGSEGRAGSLCPDAVARLAEAVHASARRFTSRTSRNRSAAWGK
jgi:uncharacterized protein (UPF0264 family)